jgi:hypothetical protein
LAAGLLVGPASADARSGLLSGKPRVREIRVLRPANGAARGSLVVWIRANRAELTATARKRLRRGTRHRVAIRVRISGPDGTIIRRPHRTLDTAASPGRRQLVETVRLSKAQVHTLGATPKRLQTKTAGKLTLAITTSQSIDLDGDGHAEATNKAIITRKRVLKSVPQVISPQDGFYDAQIPVPGRALTTPLTLSVSNHQISSLSLFGFLECTPGLWPLFPQPVIDPETGAFFLNALNTMSLDITLRGAFLSSTSAIAHAPSSVTCGGDTWPIFDMTPFVQRP